MKNNISKSVKDEISSMDQHSIATDSSIKVVVITVVSIASLITGFACVYGV
jgi:hypothetical protein